MTDDANSKSANAVHEVDIDKQRLGAVYAKALLGASEPHQMSDSVVEELDALVDEVLVAAPSLEAALASPRVALAAKEGMLDRILGGRVSDSLLTFLKVVARHGRLDCIRPIRAAARQELNAMRHRVTVRVTTAAAISDEQRQQIGNRLRDKLGSDVVLDCHVDPDVLGGLVLRIGDTVFDGSVANQLTRIKGEAIQRTFSQIRESIDRFAVSG